MSRPAISIITPSFNRPRLLELQRRAVLAQSEQDFEWLILDDSAEPCAHLRAGTDRRIHYHHHGERMSIGAKRNWLAERAAAPLIAHFDDDDYYAPHYLAAMAARLGRGADIVKLSAWFLFATSHDMLGYWDTTRSAGLHYQVSRQGIQALMANQELSRELEETYTGFGFSYVYRRTVWERTGFADRDFAEDGDFVARAMASGGVLDHFADREGLCLHVMRRDNSSTCYPQFLFPGFVVEKLFGAEVLALLA